MSKQCPHCACSESQLHKAFCVDEICPFCGQLLVSCGCMPNVLRLTPQEQYAITAYTDVEMEPLKSIKARWRQVLDDKGRIPFT
ncbi:hypothetical protein AADEFJLK_03641 [Methylovulum psychrotolerans]|uniref:Uncharacterized protein n=1 Tax=Methylovulum psychrotolerans TaxID=1704499 RepID=A0A2S5CI13_9GAMM|nr:hypothetical protein AADEFJLK_03641 [Methylovulum psychrotolerans]